MKAVVLVGGEGTRMRPLTETIPKPLIPFMNRPFLDHVLDHLARQGVEEVICSSPYLEQEFRSFLAARRGPPQLTWITEEEPLGTCGAIVGALDRVDDSFLVLNGDVLTDLDLGDLVALHRQRGAVATIALTPVEDARPYGLVETAADGRVLAFREKPAEPIPGTINAGTYVLEPRALDGVLRGTMVSIERETFPDLIAGGEPVFGLTSDAYWRDLGTPAAYLDAHEDALAGLIGGRTYPRPLVGDGAEIGLSARVGESVVLGPGARVGARARVDRSVLHARATVGEGAEVDGTLAGPGAEVGPGASVRDAVLAEGARVAPGSVVEGEGVRPGAVAGA
jgi:NDP-sugar pyrophosphorylase family protein